MAATTAGSLGVVRGAKRASGCPSLSMREFLEVPRDVAGEGRALASEIGVERMTVGAVDFDLAKERETHVVAGLAEVEDLLLAARLLPLELVAGEAEDR